MQVRNGLSANNSLILNPNGSIQREYGNNARGQYAVDLQMIKTGPTQVAGGDYSFIGGGSSNTIIGLYGTIAGGQSNSMGSDYGAIGGGYGNSVSTSATYGVVSGGSYNQSLGAHDAIIGGRGLQLNGSNSFGYNANSAGTRDASISASNVGYLGNVDLWIANNDGTARSLRFYESYNTAGAFPNTANYSAFKAGTQNVDIVYTLPLDTPSAAGSLLQVVSKSGTSPQTVQLGWTSGGGQGWLLTGNTLTLTDTSTSFLGTTSGVFVEIHAEEGGGGYGEKRVFRFEPNSTSPNLIGGSRLNWISGGFKTANRVYGASILGGGTNNAENRVTDNYGIVLGGNNNRAGDNDNTYSDKEYAVVAGGLNNNAEGQYSFIAGGSNLTLTGDSTFGYNAGIPMTISASRTAVLGSANLWLANNTNTASELRYFEPYNTSGAFPNTANYTAFKAGTQSADITYTLPTAAPTVNGQVLTSGTTGTMSWTNNLRNSGGNEALQIGTSATADGYIVQASNLVTNNAGNNPTPANGYSVYEFTGNAYGGNATFPGVATTGKMITIINNTNGAIGVVTAAGNVNIAQNEAMMLISNGTNWFRIR